MPIVTSDGRGIKVVVSPDAFRGSIDAVAAAAALARGLESAWPAAEVVRLPIADGGEGTVDCAVACGFRAETVSVLGPLGDPVQGRIAVRGSSAVIELAELCGWARLPANHTAPMTSDTRGLGGGILAALDLGCDDLVIAVGGSVSTDAGIGMLRVLGAEPRDADDEPVTDPGGGTLHRIRSIDVAGLDPRLRTTRFRLATDVDNPLVGPRGAAAVFGPQKGASADDVANLDAGLTLVADLVERATGVRTHDLPGAGAAGGVGATAVPYLGAEIVSGADVVLDLVGFDATTADATWVVTGEGKWDGQSGGGKAPARAAARAHAVGVRVALVAGVIDATDAGLASSGFAAHCALAELEPNLARCMTDAEVLLTAAGAELTQRMPKEPCS